MSIPHDMNKQDALKAYRIIGLPPNFYYIPNFITKEEEASILQKVGSYLPVIISAAYIGRGYNES